MEDDSQNSIRPDQSLIIELSPKLQGKEQVLESKGFIEKLGAERVWSEVRSWKLTTQNMASNFEPSWPDEVKESGFAIVPGAADEACC